MASTTTSSTMPPPTTTSNGSTPTDIEKTSQSDKSAAEPTRNEDNFEYPPAKSANAVILALCIVIFISALDRLIVATAIPQMTNEFHSLDDIGWYGSAFLLTSCCLLLLAGRTYTYYSPKIVFLIVIVIFEIGSLICATAPNSTAFIVGRAIAGIGGAGVMNGAVTLLSCTVPLAKRPKYQGMFGAAFGLASVVGPLLGGVFTTKVTWRWCFYINLPIGAVAIAVIALAMKAMPGESKGLPLKQKFLQLDPLGALLIIPSLICLLLALQWGGGKYDWTSGRVIVLLVVFAVLFVAFCLVQVFMRENATIPLHIIKNRSILAAQLYVFCLNGSFNVVVFYVPLWFQVIQNVNAIDSGIRTFPLILSMVVGIIGSGVLTGKIGYYTPLAYAASIIAPIGIGLMATWKPDTSKGMWIGYQILVGFGNGIGFSQANMAAQTVLKRRDVPTGASIVQFCQLLGGTVFIAVGQNLLTSSLAAGLAPLVPGLDARTVGNLGAVELRNLVAPDQLGALLNVYNDAIRQIFLMAAGLASASALGALGLEWKNVNKAEKEHGETKAPQEGV